MRLLRVVALLAALGTCLNGRPAVAAPIVLTDAGHHELRFEESPKRIVSLLPSLTESVCELGECARLVATDVYSNWPESVQHLPKTGGLEDVQIEQVVSAKPDVVLLAHSPRVLDHLRSLGIVTFEFNARTYPDIATNITTLGVLLGVPERATALNARIEKSVSELAAETRKRLGNRSPLVYYEVDAGPYGAGPESFIGTELSRLGARNILTPDMGLFPKLNPEYVVRANPDVIMISPKEAPNLVNRPGWGEIRAVREQRVCSFAPEDRDTIVRPGPRITEGLKALGDCLVRVSP